MLRRLVSVVAVLFVLVGFVSAGNYNGVITEHKDGKITVKYKKDKEDTEWTEKKFKVSKDVKITRKTKDGEDEIKAEDLAATIEKAAKGKGKGGAGGKGKGKGGFGGGLFARITTEGEGDAETVTTIVIGGAGRGKKKDN